MGLQSHNQTYLGLCITRAYIYNCAISEPLLIQNQMHIPKTIMHIQSLGIVGTVYLGIFRDIQPHSHVRNQGEEGRSHLLFLKIQKSALIAYVILRIQFYEFLEEKSPNSFPMEPLFLAFFLCLPQLFSAPALRHYSFCKTSHLKCLTVF